MDSFDKWTADGKGFASPARMEYLRTFDTEIELNDMFNTFVTNYQRAYQGPNTARAQIGSKYSTGVWCTCNEALSTGALVLPKESV